MTVRRAFGLALVMTAAAAAPWLHADEGMWPLNHLDTAGLQRKYGFTPPPEWLKHVQLASIRFVGAEGCSGGLVSANGLAMTNYHCVVECVQGLSAQDRNLLQTGFYAASAGDERQCPNMEVNELTEVSDVTSRIAAATANMEGERFDRARKAAFAAIERECATGDEVRCDVVTLYQGGRYDLYKYRRFQDVRLVFAPEFDTGFFGGDPDNFMFPRFDLDVAFVRVYERGAPLRADDWFRWSPQGASAGDLVFVSGHPGTTARQDTVSQLEFERDVRLPTYLMFYSELRGLLIEFIKQGPEQARVGAPKLVFIENALKVLRGQFDALADPRLIQLKRSDEASLRRAIGAKPALQQKAGGAWDAIDRLMQRKRDPWRRRIALSMLTQSELFEHALRLVRIAAEQAKPDAERLPAYRDAALPAMRQEIASKTPYDEAFETMMLAHSLMYLRERLGLDDPAVKAILGRRSPDEIAADAIKKTTLKDADARLAVMHGGRQAIDASSDPLIALAKAFDPFDREARKPLDEEIDPDVERNQALIAQSKFAIQGDTVYPDATFTLRLTYGTVKGWNEGGHDVKPFTTFRGLYDRHTGSPPFKLPARWLDQRGSVALDTPFDFVADTDITGGNSGSPIIDRAGRIVGVAFDGNIHSIGGEYWFDAETNRTVGVDSRGIVEALKSVYHADRVLQEIGRP